MDNFLKWNGAIIQSDDILSIEFTEINYVMKIKLKNLNFRGFVRYKKCTKIKCYTSCLMDELKPTFGLNKIGTRWTYFNESYYVLYPLEYIENDTINVFPCVKYSLKLKLCGALASEIKKLLIFNYIFQIITVPKDISIQYNKNGIYPVSYSNHIFDTSKDTIHQALCDMFFESIDDECIEHVYKIFKGHKDLQDALFYFEEEFSKITKRLNFEQYYFEDIIKLAIDNLMRILK